MNVAIVNCFDTYEHRVNLLHDFFTSRGDNVKVYTSDFRHFEKVRRDDCKADYIYIKTKAYQKNISIQRLSSHYSLAKDIFKRLLEQKLDLLWVFVPPNSFVKEAAQLKQIRPQVKVIFDIIDMWPETMPVEGVMKFPPIMLWKNLRDSNLKAADFVITECTLFQEILKKSYPETQMKTIYLAREVKPFVSNLSLPDNKIALCYLGSINNIIDISLIERIIQEISKKKSVIFHIIGDGEKKKELIRLSKSAGAEIIDHGKVYDSVQKQKIFDSCHYGLNIMKDSVFVGFTMKSMDYFEAGLPIINNIKGDTWEMVEKYKLGVNLDDKTKLNLQDLDRKFVRTFFETQLSNDKFNNKMVNLLKQLQEQNV